MRQPRSERILLAVVLAVGGVLLAWLLVTLLILALG